MKIAPFILVLSCVILGSCKNSADANTKAASLEELPVIQLKTKDTFLQKRYVAQIQAIQNVELRNKVEGYLEKIYVDEGQVVKKGQLLFSINKEEFQTMLAKAQASLSNAVAEAKGAEVQLKRVKLLVDKDIISATELDVAKAELRAKQARIQEARSIIANARTLLSYTNIRAPFSGIINRIPLKVGSLLNEGSLLTTVSDISSVYAYFSIAEDEYLQYLRDKQEQRNSSSADVSLELADGSQYQHVGKVETTSSEIERGTGAIAFRAKFPNPKKILHHGATGEIVMRTKVSNALLLPQKAAFEIQDRSYVYLVDSSNRVKMKHFLPQSRIAGLYVVQSGLIPGERVVYEGTQGLKEGVQIKPRLVDLETIMQQSSLDEPSLAQTRH